VLTWKKIICFIFNNVTYSSKCVDLKIYGLSLIGKQKTSENDCRNGVWLPLRPVSVVQNKSSTMSSSNVQSIDSPTDYTTWRSWTMRQPNGYSTPARYLGGLAVDKRTRSNERRRRTHYELFVSFRSLNFGFNTIRINPLLVIISSELPAITNAIHKLLWVLQTIPNDN